jgi:Na+(H+)/acetate symporter ActP
MAIIVKDIPAIEFFLILIMLFLGSVGLQAVTHKQYLTSEDIKDVLRSVFKGLILLALLATILLIIAFVAK